MNTQQEYSDKKQDSKNLYVENEQLKRDLEKEEFLHKALYKQWNELNVRMLAKERELKRLKSGNLFYKYGFYLILFSLAPAYYFFSTSKEDKEITASSQTVSSPAQTAPTTNQALPNDQDTVYVSKVKLEEKQVIQTDTVKPKLVINSKPVIAKPLTDSIRNMIYSEGWDGYYEKSRNPYQKFSQKYNLWMQGWKDAEKDDKKALTRNSFDTIK